MLLKIKIMNHQVASGRKTALLNSTSSGSDMKYKTVVGFSHHPLRRESGPEICMQRRLHWQVERDINAHSQFPCLCVCDVNFITSKFYESLDGLYMNVCVQPKTLCLCGLSTLSMHRLDHVFDKQTSPLFISRHVTFISMSLTLFWWSSYTF